MPPELVAEREVEIGADGTVKVEIDTAVAKAIHGDEDHSYTITAEVVDASRRTIVGSGSVLVARKPFSVHAWVDRGYYRIGDTIRAGLAARRLDGKPVEGRGELTLLKISYEKGKPVETPVQTWKLDTDAEGQAQQQLTASQAGQYRLSYKVTDAKKHTIEGGYIFTIIGEGFDSAQFRFNHLELVPDKADYAPGDKVKLQINTDRAGSTVLLFARPTNGVYLKPTLIHLDGKSTVREIEVVKRDMPNFFVEAVTVADGRVYTETREIVVPPENRVLNIEVKPLAQVRSTGSSRDSGKKPPKGGTRARVPARHRVQAGPEGQSATQADRLRRQAVCRFDGDGHLRQVGRVHLRRLERAGDQGVLLEVASQPQPVDGIEPGQLFRQRCSAQHAADERSGRLWRQRGRRSRQSRRRRRRRRRDGRIRRYNGPGRVCRRQGRNAKPRKARGTCSHGADESILSPDGRRRDPRRLESQGVDEGEATIRMKALTDEESDAMEQKFPCYIHGALKMEARSGVIRGQQTEGTMGFDVPEKRRPKQSRLEVRYSPTLAGAMVDALPYLVDYPYGCTEQTLNRFLPTVITQKVLLDMKLDLAEIRKKRTNLNAQEIGDDTERARQWKRYDRNPVFDEDEVRRMVKDGVNRLTEMQLSDGGWGWFSGFGEHSSAHTTALVVHGLQVAKSNDVALVPGMLEKGVDWLRRYQDEQVPVAEERGDREEAGRPALEGACRRAGRLRLHDPRLRRREERRDARVPLSRPHQDRRLRPGHVWHRPGEGRREGKARPWSCRTSTSMCSRTTRTRPPGSICRKAAGGTGTAASTRPRPIT